MVSNDLKKKKAGTDIRMDILQYKLISVFILAVISTFGFLKAMNSIANQVTFIKHVLPALLIISGVGVIAAAVLFALRTSRHANDSGRVFTKWNILGTSIVFFGACLYYRLTLDATMVVLGIIAATVLYFIYHIFKTDFFIFTVVTTIGILLFKMSGVIYYTSHSKIITSVCFGAAIVTAVVALAFAVLLIVGKGKINIGDREFDIIGKNGQIYPIILASALTMTGGIVGFAAYSMINYVIAALLIVYLAIAVVYAIKMM